MPPSHEHLQQKETFFNCALPTKGKHFYSSSESEEEEEAHKKFNIKIKPLQAKDILKSAATVDELKASIGNIALSPSPVVSSQCSSLSSWFMLHRVHPKHAWSLLLGANGEVCLSVLIYGVQSIWS